MDSNLADIWSKSETLALITAYKKHPLLYKVSHPCYVNQKKKREALFIVLKELQKLNIDTSVEEIKKKWQSLNRQLLFERRKMNAHLQSGRTMKTFKASLWCFDELVFLLEVNKKILNSSNLNISAEEEIEVSEEEELDEDEIQMDDIPDRVESKTRVQNIKLKDGNQGKNSLDTLQNCAEKSIELLASLLKKSENKKVESFCSMLSSELKEFKYPETYDAVTMEILYIVKNMKAKIRQDQFEAISHHDYGYDEFAEESDPISVHNSTSNARSNKRKTSTDSSLMYEDEIEEIVLG